MTSTSNFHHVFIGIGSNLEDPVHQVEQALVSLSTLPSSHVVNFSSLYQSKPMGPAGQPDYINAAAAVDTLLEPVVLLHELQKIESQQGRVHTTERWGPRTIDLDILVYDDRKISTKEITIPHLGIHERAFVLYPLQEIAPELNIPGLGTLHELITHYNETHKENGLKRLDGVA